MSPHSTNLDKGSCECCRLQEGSRFCHPWLKAVGTQSVLSAPPGTFLPLGAEAALKLSPHFFHLCISALPFTLLLLMLCGESSQFLQGEAVCAGLPLCCSAPSPPAQQPRSASGLGRTSGLPAGESFWCLMSFVLLVLAQWMLLVPQLLSASCPSVGGGDLISSSLMVQIGEGSEVVCYQEKSSFH